MNQYIKLLPALALGMTMGSCVDDAILPFAVEKPTSIAQYEYLNNYDVLKSYVDRAKNPNFKLGLAASVSDFVQKGVVYEAVTTNFDEMTAGNAMKYASVVADDGTMNFSTVSNFVETAKAAGITIYGHTLGWHAQQNMTYLNGLIADKEIEFDPGDMEEVQDAYFDYSTYTDYPFYVMGYTPEFVDGCMVSHYPGEWYQYFVADQIPTAVGQNYKLTVCIQGSAPGSLNAQFGNWGNLLEQTVSFNEEWQEVSVEFANCPVESSFVVFQPGTFEGDVKIKWLKVTHTVAPSIGKEVPVIEHDYSDGEPISGWGADLSISVVDGACVIENPSAAQSWEKQLCYEQTTPFENGKTYFLRLKVKGTKDGAITAGFQNPNGYVGCGDFPAFAVTTDWQEVKVSTTCTGDNATRLLFNVGDYEGTLYFDDVCLYYEEKTNVIEMTPEEKKDTLTWALQNWVKGMMEATGGYVTAWDLANETVSGADNDGDGIYDLQSSANGDPSTNFYWTDYLGDIDYVRILESSARKYFKEYGGDPSQLKLFINDFNLESWWDGNQKAKSLVEWIKRWESDGVTKIDGIATQMHVSYILNEADQKAQEDAIVNMFKILAESGKLVKISELDMGIVDKAFGTAIKTENVTYEQQLKMSEFYQFIISKYFEIIPVEQQYGITQWCATDSPADSGWRPGEPTGLWDSSYKRKPTYAGFANGLAGKVVAEPSEELSQGE
ncbi:MAG TPA: endo-1,4-beta-xylanase [Bacteroides mediterraneensis]|uniref:endo-1,4-beta-xylanase n=1 Tax=Bacteroides mediterraneensis TaxID=1841856 RepID=UPI00262AA6A3|nr:endo-1,4-beta-xylanase [Bacteroides mediterraneensis]HJH63620.1 endo-1,4-beta-xylanase [Bacteroides mediterraneensis]